MLVSVKQHGITSYMPVFYIQEQKNRRPNMIWDDKIMGIMLVLYLHPLTLKLKYKLVSG